MQWIKNSLLLSQKEAIDAHHLNNGLNNKEC